MAKLGLRLSLLLRRSRETERLREELAFHLEEQTRENLAAGMPPEEARAAALRLFGNPLLLREQARAAWPWQALEQCMRDLRQGVRRLGRSPGFSLSVVLILGLGVGAVAALFTVVHAVLLQPLPFAAQDRLVQIYEADGRRHTEQSPVAGGTFQMWREGSHSFEQLALSYNSQLEENLTGAGGQLPERVRVEVGTGNLLATLGVQPAVGRFFTSADDRIGAPETVVLTWQFFGRRYSANPSALGTTLTLDAKPYTVIGVLPRWFHYPDAKTQLWTPLLPGIEPASGSVLASHDAHNFRVFGRLKPGVSLGQAQTELAGLSGSYARHTETAWINDSAHVVPLLDAQVGELRTGLYALLGATGCLLLIACLNVTNLLLARSASGRRESAIRAALGGGLLARLRAQLAETLLLSLAGGLLGVLLAYFGVAWLRYARADLPRSENIHLDPLALAVALAVACCSGLLAGVVPVLATSDRSLLGALREGAGSHSGGKPALHLRKALIGAEVAVTVVLLVGAGLLLKSYSHLRAVDFGCDPRNALTLGLSLPDARYATPASRIQFFDQLLTRVRALPGVRTANLSTTLPGQGQYEDDAYAIHEDPPLAKGQGLDADVRWVDPGYFAALRIPLLRGRTFLPQERGDRRHYALISASLARTVFAGRDPIGRHVDDENNEASSYPAATNPSNEIIGVVGDVRSTAAAEPRPTIYYPLYGGIQGDASLIVRTEGDPLAWSLPIQKVVADIDPTLAVADVLPFQDVLLSSTADTSFQASVLAAFAVLSLALAVAGLFGVLSYVVATRTGELGIRLALGAPQRQILSLVLYDGLRPALAGVAAGLLASAALTRFIASLLHGAQPLDPLVYAGVSALLLLTAAAACGAPAWRASRLDPAEVLRSE